MGVLEDAIREHLELRRRHGASEEEVGRQEAEALGAARRDTSSAEASDLEAAGPADEASALLEHDDEPRGADAGGEPPVSGAGTEHIGSEDLDFEDIAPDEVPSEESLGGPAAAREEAPEQLPTGEETDVEEPASAAHGGETPPRGFPAVTEDGDPVEETGPEGERDSAERDEDLLEGSRDYVEETPERGRLWSEQKPRRDFDFD
jgi:hypothetical protein